MQTNPPETNDPATTGTEPPAVGDVRESINECCCRVRDAIEKKAAEVGESTVQSVGHYVDVCGNSLESAANSLAEQGAESAAEFTREASDRLKSAAERISSTSAEEALQIASEQARRRPAVALLCAFAIGILSARLLGSREDHHSAA